MSGAEVDHLVVAATSLEQGVAWCEATLGITPSHRSPEALGAMVREVDQAHAAMIKTADYRMP